MKRTKLKKKSPKGKLISQIEDYIRIGLKEERGAKCEICGRAEESLPYPLSLFHILEKNAYPRIRFHRENLLLACWSKQRYIRYCHNIWHNYPHLKNKIETEIKRLRGEDYLERLKVINATAPKITMFYLQNLLEAYKKSKESV